MLPFPFPFQFISDFFDKIDLKMEPRRLDEGAIVLCSSNSNAARLSGSLFLMSKSVRETDFPAEYDT